jgi:hypothetical protein
MNFQNNKNYNDLSKTYVNLKLDGMFLISLNLNSSNLLNSSDFLDFSSIISDYTNVKNFSSLTIVKYWWWWLHRHILDTFPYIRYKYPKIIFLGPIRPYLLHMFDSNGTYMGCIWFYIDNSINHNEIINDIIKNMENVCREWSNDYAYWLSDCNKYYFFINQDFYK